MSIEDPRPGDRFRVTFEGTFRAAPDRLWIGEGAGLSWGTIAEHAASVEPIAPKIEPGEFYVDTSGNAYRAYQADEGMCVSDFAGNLFGLARPFPPGLRRARIVPDDAAELSCGCA